MNKILNKTKHSSGFTLLYAIITTGVLLLVSFIVVNIATKQLLISSSNQQSQYAFYNSDSGIECAVFWDTKSAISPFDPYNTFPISGVSCNGSAISLASAPPIVGGYATTTFQINLTKGCVIIDVTKKVGLATTTSINSRGYNNCSLGALRRYERGINILYGENGIPIVVAPLDTVLNLFVVTTGSSGGTVSGGGITCGPSCQVSFPKGTTDVSLIPAPDGFSVFSGWSGDCSGNGSCIVTLDTQKSVTANFVVATPTDLNVSTAGSNGAGVVTSNPVGINCGTVSGQLPCVFSFAENRTVALTATPNSASSFFFGWSGSGCSGSAGCSVTMDSVKSVTAVFKLLTRTLTVSPDVTGTGFGTVTSNIGPINCGGVCVGGYDHGTTIVLTATPSFGSTFTSWTGCTSTSGTNNEICTVSSILANKTVVPKFTAIPRLLTLNKTSGTTGTGTVTSSPSGINCTQSCTTASSNFNNGATITLTATPRSGSSFTSWTSGCSSTSGTSNEICTVANISAPVTVVANFETSRTLNVSKNGGGSGTITSSPTGINCNASCTSSSASYANGSNIDLIAVEASGMNFTGWTGCTSTSGVSNEICTVSNITGTVTINATFVSLKTLTISKTGSTGTGLVTSEPAGINCGTTACSYKFDTGTNIVLSAAPVSGSVLTSWTGCTSVTGNDCTVTNFTANTTVTAVFGLGNSLDYLVVAGGGGGSSSGAGGGAGGMRTGSLTATMNKSYTVVVGGAGAGGVGANGGNSQFDTVVSTGGGHGDDLTSTPFSGTSGGSGGGGGAWIAGPTYGGNGTAGQGKAGGGNGGALGGYQAGGGGGAGVAAPTATVANVSTKGGDGLPSDISGSNVYYAGGGGGINYYHTSPGVGGLGGGGAGGAAGTPNTGGGGGGGGGGAGIPGSAGGSGIVIIRYPGAVQQGTGGNAAPCGSYYCHTFTTVGTTNFTFTGPPPTATCASGGSGSTAFTFTGANQTFKVPTACTSITVKVWGAGGGGTYSGTPVGNLVTSSGGAGGYTTGVIAVTANTNLTVVVGQGGNPAGNVSTTFGGGGRSNAYAGGGGGRSAIRNSSNVELVTAGGGGGGGSSFNASYNGNTNGGPGGGSFGADGFVGNGNTAVVGKGGTQSAGGAGGTGYPAYPGGAGSALTGGSSGSNYAGGGGGGGWFGGGAAAHISSTVVGGGGGGSSYFGGTGVSSACTMVGSGANAPNTSDSSYASGVGVGFVGSALAGDGRVVISWPGTAPTCPQPIVRWTGPTTGSQNMQTTPTLTFTTPGTYTVTFDTTMTLNAVGVAGGGAGGSSTYNSYSSSGGGGGGITTSSVIPFEPGVSYVFVVGAGGQPIQSSGGATGGLTYINDPRDLSTSHIALVGGGGGGSPGGSGGGGGGQYGRFLTNGIAGGTGGTGTNGGGQVAPGLCNGGACGGGAGGPNFACTDYGSPGGGANGGQGGESGCGGVSVARNGNRASGYGGGGDQGDTNAGGGGGGGGSLLLAGGYYGGGGGGAGAITTPSGSNPLGGAGNQGVLQVTFVSAP